MSHFFPQKDDAPTREPLSNDQLIWKGAPSFDAIAPAMTLCWLLFWLVVPLWFAYRIWSKNNTTEYLVTKRYIQIRNDHFERENRILEIYRVRSVESQPSSSSGKADVIFYPTDDYTPPVRYIGVMMSGEELKRIRDAVEATHEKKRVSSISLPVLN